MQNSLIIVIKIVKVRWGKCFSFSRKEAVAIPQGDGRRCKQEAMPHSQISVSVCGLSDARQWPFFLTASRLHMPLLHSRVAFFSHFHYGNFLELEYQKIGILGAKNWES